MHRLTILIVIFLFCCAPKMANAAPPVASFTVTASSVCQDSCLTLTSTSTGSIDSIRWKLVVYGVPVMMSNLTSYLLCTTSSFPAGSYLIRLVVYGGGVADSSSQPITVKQTPNPVITKSGDTLSVSGSYLSYQWYNGATSIPGATSASYTVTSSGSYSVVVDSGGCPGSSNTITAHALGVNNGLDVENAYWTSQAGNEGLQLNSRQPVSEPLRIDITDQAGRKMISDPWLPGSATQSINTASFPRGIYYILLSNSSTRKVLRWLKN